MAEAYVTNSGTFTIKEVVDAFVNFLGVQDPTEAVWSIRKGKTGAPYGDDWNASSGKTGDPLIIGKTNGTTEEDFIIHIWENDRNNLAFNLSAGPFDRAVGTTWNTEPNARYGRSGDADRRRENTPQQYYANMNTSVVEQYHFFYYDDNIWVVFKATNGVWANFSFGHYEKLIDCVGGAYVCCSYNSIFSTQRDIAADSHNIMFIDMIGSSDFESTNDNWHCPHFRCDTQAGDFRYCIGMYMYNYEDKGGRSFNNEYMGTNDTAGSCGGITYANKDKLASFDFDKIQTTSSFGLTAPLIPVYMYSGGVRKSYTWSLVGKMPNVFGMNIRNFSETSLISVQGTDYMVFPRSRKTDSPDTNDAVPNSYHYGFILRKPA